MNTLGSERMDHLQTRGVTRGATRRQVLGALSSAALAAAAPASPPAVDAGVVARNDAAVEGLLSAQITDPANSRLGGVADEYGMFPAGAAAALIETAAAAWVVPKSKHHAAPELLERIRQAAQFLERSESAEGFIDLLSTNFNSPPDTGFVVHNVATAAAIAKLYGAEEILRALRPFLVKAANGISVGGIHTPNHRWVVSSALAQVNQLFPDPVYTRRIAQWLAESIDIDEDGQFIERSTITYNTVIDRAFTVLAAKLQRPELLDPVRRNLQAMMYLLHPDGEVVTEVSRRQDQFVRGTMAGYWFPLNYLAVHDGDRQFAGLARILPADSARLPVLLEYPELAGALPTAAPLPEDYEKWFAAVGLARIRRGRWDATLVLKESSRFFSARNGGAVVNAVRFASSFFGKGQFVPDTCIKEGTNYVFRQSLSAPYYQPLTPPQKVDYKNWGALRSQRRQTQVCKLEQSATVVEQKRGFELRLQSNGTPGVPVAVEISLREGGELQGCRPAPHVPDGWVLEKDFATYRAGGDTVRFGPGAAAHLLTQLRGAEPKLPGQSVYLTGYTPFDHTLRFEFA
jgi:hypothetical protein